VGARVTVPRAIKWTPESLFGQAACQHYIAESASAGEAFLKRLKKAKSKDEKVKATIDFFVGEHRRRLESYGRDQQAKEIVDLIDSESPLDREGRREISEKLRQLLSLPLQYSRDLSYEPIQPDPVHMKDFLQTWAGLTASEAEGEVASHLGVEAETLKKQKQRAMRETYEQIAEQSGISVEMLRNARQQVERATRPARRQARQAMRRWLNGYLSTR
jgi:hypothetical protein